MFYQDVLLAYYMFLNFCMNLRILKISDGLYFINLNFMGKCKYAIQQRISKYTLFLLQFKVTYAQDNLRKYCRVCLQLPLTGRFIETGPIYYER